MPKNLADAQVGAVEPLEGRLLLSETSYTQQNLVSDGASNAPHTDTRLVNPWGLAVGPNGIEVADNGTGVGTMYDAAGNNVIGTVRVPGHAGEKGAPTGVVINSDVTAFPFGGRTSPAQFIFVTENGTIDAWSGKKTDKTASVVVDNSSAGANYKGAAIARFKRKPFLYAANFAVGKVEVYDSNFRSSHVSGRFSDPNLPRGFSPFNITSIDNQLWVAYAKKETGGDDEVVGPGTGVVDVFGTDGKLVRRFTAGGKLNAPWGVAKAPSNFGVFSNAILVGNFGDGRITAFDAKTGARKGQLSNASNVPIVLEGLWGIAFGNGKAGNLTNGLRLQKLLGIELPPAKSVGFARVATDAC
jgi:uncharacterized protein (TIGR03118 family)